MTGTLVAATVPANPAHPATVVIPARQVIPAGREFPLLAGIPLESRIPACGCGCGCGCASAELNSHPPVPEFGENPARHPYPKGHNIEALSEGATLHGDFKRCFVLYWFGDLLSVDGNDCTGSGEFNEWDVVVFCKSKVQKAS